jgi:hypothetical protein
VPSCVCVDGNSAKVRASIYDDQLAVLVYLCVGENGYKETEIDMGGLRSPDLALGVFCAFLGKVRLWVANKLPGILRWW